jgi:arylsulfatase A-like enzyme
VPLIVRWPGVTVAGSVLPTPVITMDITATCLAVAGVQPAVEQAVDGLNLADIITGKNKTANARTLFWRRRITDNNSAVKGRAVRQGDWKLLEDIARKKTCLYNLAADPTETNDVSRQEPAKLAELQAALATWEQMTKGTTDATP